MPDADGRIPPVSVPDVPWHEHSIALHAQAPQEDARPDRWYYSCGCGLCGPLRKSPGAAQRDADGHRRATGTL